MRDRQKIYKEYKSVDTRSGVVEALAIINSTLYLLLEALLDIRFNTSKNIKKRKHGKNT